MTLLQTEVGNSRASEPSRKKNRDIALYKTAPLAVDLRERERERERDGVWGCDVGFNIFKIYSNVRLFNALYVRIAKL